jgi:hypothetical protein
MMPSKISVQRATTKGFSNRWMALTPPELAQAHLNLDQRTIAALRKDKPIIVK